jgi:DNA polymerase III epsilon subunit-like protein|tara:strand:+ start:5779 stop:6387 length:609 start_codon:yes stop_codon:yes gene_type:complete
MSNHIDKIVEALPEGLTETGIEEVAVLLDEVVEDRVAEEVKLLEAKVKAFLRTKLDELKGTAQRELEADNKLVRAYKVFEAVKTIVAAELESEDVTSAVKTYEVENTRLQSEVVSINVQLEESLKTVNLLESKLDHRESELSQLSEALVDEKEKAEIPFKSSESAVMISNESHGSPSLPAAALENFFLNEDVIRLSNRQERS